MEEIGATTGTGFAEVLKLGKISRLAREITLIGDDAMAQIYASARVSRIEGRVLMLVDRGGTGQTSAVLARALIHDTGALSRVISRLEYRGLIQREVSGLDRRSILIDLTARGAEVAGGLGASMQEFWDAKLGGWHHADVIRLVALMFRLAHPEPKRDRRHHEPMQQSDRTVPVKRSLTRDFARHFA